VKEINGKRSGKSALEIDDVLPIDTDLNSVIRENFEFLKEQMVIDACDVRFIREDGKDWVKKRTGKTIQEIAKSDESIRFRLESFIGEELNVDGWHFQSDDLDFPNPTREWISVKTGIPVKRLENLDKPQKFYPGGGRTGGLAFTVEELVAIARATHTSIQFLLTPSASRIASGRTFGYQSSVGKVLHASTASRWILWLYSLRPLPEQSTFLFERNGSYLAGELEARTKTAKPFRDDVIKGLARSRYGAFSMFSSVENYDPLDKNLAEVKISTPLKSKPTKAEQELWEVKNTFGIFVELRKLMRDETLKSNEKLTTSRWRSGVAKLINHVVRLGRLLRLPNGSCIHLCI
jgi:hypothetical protein